MEKINESFEDLIREHAFAELDNSSFCVYSKKLSVNSSKTFIEVLFRNKSSSVKFTHLKQFKNQELIFFFSKEKRPFLLLNEQGQCFLKNIKTVSTLMGFNEIYNIQIVSPTLLTEENIDKINVFGDYVNANAPLIANLIFEKKII